jgi:hypothetical protein
VRLSQFIGTIEALALPKLVPMLLWLPLWGRIAVAILMIAPLGLAMGMPFRVVETDWRRFFAGAAVLLGTERHHVGDRISDDSVRRAHLGFQAAMLMGSACYVLAALASVKAFSRQLAVSSEQ